MTNATRPIRSIVIAGGGTGGHVYPGVAIAEEVLRRNPEAKVAFIGTSRGMEAQILPVLGYPLETISVSRLKGGGLWSKLKGVLRLPVGVFQSWRILRRHRPEVVVGVGGYASGPALIAAWLTWRKTAIQEQNATPGLTNRWLGKIAKRVFVGFAAASKHFKPAKTIASGNPIRRAIAERLVAPGRPDANDLSDRDDLNASRVPSDLGGVLRVLVFGGSQGAAFLNERVPELLVRVVARGIAVTVLHQTGPAAVEVTAERYALLGGHATVVPFVERMAEAYAGADLAICRAGALTLAEVTAVGLPSLLVPFPHAADNHQEANARVLEAAGAAMVCSQSSWDTPALVERLVELGRDRAKLQAMGAAALTLARPDAARVVVDHLEALAA